MIHLTQKLEGSRQRALQNDPAKIYDARNPISGERFQAETVYVCPKSCTPTVSAWNSHIYIHIYIYIYIYTYIHIYIVYMWQMSSVFSLESVQRNDAGNYLIDENVIKTKRPFLLPMVSCNGFVIPLFSHMLQNTEKIGFKPMNRS